jgi:hypothetical protein
MAPEDTPSSNSRIVQEFQQAKAALTDRQGDQAASQTREPEPSRPQEVRPQARMNAPMLNQDRPAPEAKEIPASAVADRTTSPTEARDRVALENEQVKEKRIKELAERFRTTENIQTPEKQKEQER